MREYKKLKHQAPKDYQPTEFNQISIDGDFAYCASHHFIYNSEEQKKLLYDGKPCYYTDGRFQDGSNFYKEAIIFWQRWKAISFKSCIRRIQRLKGVPKGTLIKLSTSFYYPNKKFNTSYIHKVKKENSIPVDYQVNYPSYEVNFITCDFSRELTDRLRAEGFIVSVREDNENFISSMISTAAALKGKVIETQKELGQVALAYGHGKKIGFSSHNNTVFGYSSGCDNILWDRFGEFDKWSRCNEILKTTSIDEIVEILKNRNDE